MAPLDLPPIPGTTKQTIGVPHGIIAVTLSQPSNTSTSDSDTEFPSLLLLHSNSSCSHAFQHILQNPPRGIQQVIALDFLGHGESSNAQRDIESAYTMRGYAKSAVHVLKELTVTEVIILGWSLGGHVGIEMLSLLRETAETTFAISITARGLMIIGTPPANGREEVERGFDVKGTGQVDEGEDEDDDEVDEDEGDEHIGLAGTETWSPADAKSFAASCHGPPVQPWMAETGSRTDGRARRIMFSAFRAGTGIDQRRVLEEIDVPVAVVNGADEPFVNLDYVDGVRYRNLWGNRCLRLPGCGHAPFWEKPEPFRACLEAFVRDYLHM